MPFSLLPLSRLQLEWLAESREPEELQPRAEPGSLPPSFVAARSLKLAGEAESKPWSTTFLIVRSEDSRFVGACGFKTAPSAGRIEVGYGVSPIARRQGAATAALNMLSQLAFEFGASEVLAEILPENTASIRVVQKAGFTQVGSRIDEGNAFVTQWLRCSGPNQILFY
jgi:RimJ/RimL family protein N-acetyltransferase